MLLLLVDAAEDPLEAGLGASLWALVDKVRVVAPAVLRACHALPPLTLFPLLPLLDALRCMHVPMHLKI